MHHSEHRRSTVMDFPDCGGYNSKALSVWWKIFNYTVTVGICLIYTVFFHQEMITIKCDTVSTENVSSYTVIKKTLRGSVSKNCSKCNINVHIYCILFYQNDFSRYWPLDSHKKYSICNNSNQKYCMIFFKDKIEIKNTV